MDMLELKDMEELEKIKKDFFVQYNIKEDDMINSIASVLKKTLGFKVKEMELPQNIDGAILVDSKGALTRNNQPIKIIVVNKNINKYKQRFTVAHEFAHYILSEDRELLAFRDHSKNKEKQNLDLELENKVDYLAASILMPLKTFSNDIEKLKNESQEYKYTILHQKYRVEIPAITYREREVEVLKNA